jgi:hypothetical protein
MGRLFLITLIAVSTPVLAYAQHHAGAASPASGHAAMAGVRAPSPGSRPSVGVPAATQAGGGFGTHLQASGRRIRPANRHGEFVPRAQFDTTDFEDVPGLGFDFPHLAAVSGNRHHRGHLGAFPFGFDGFLLGAPPVILEEAAPAEAQAAAEEGAASDGETHANYVRRSRSQREPSSTPALDADNSVSAPEDATEYVFVRRDGGLVFAVGYSWVNGTLRYVTREGLRRTLASDAIDLNATLQFNEQRGLNFRTPA